MKNWQSILKIGGAITAFSAGVLGAGAAVKRFGRSLGAFSIDMVMMRADEAIKNLEHRIEMADFAGAQTAMVSSAMGNFTRELQSTFSLLIATFGPLIQSGINILTMVMKAVNIVLGWLMLVLKPILVVLSLILDSIVTFIEWVMGWFDLTNYGLKQINDSLDWLMSWFRKSPDIKHMERAMELFGGGGMDRFNQIRFQLNRNQLAFPAGVGGNLRGRP